MGEACDAFGTASVYNFNNAGPKFCDSSTCQLGPFACSGNGDPPVVMSGPGSRACQFFQSGEDTVVDGKPAKKSYGHIITMPGKCGVCYAVQSKSGDKNIVVIMGIDQGCLNECTAGQSPELGCDQHGYLAEGTGLVAADRIPVMWKEVPCPGVGEDTSKNCD